MGPQTSSVPRREDLELRAAPPVAFVLGASGYVGASLVDALARDEHVARVIAHVRPDSPRADALTTRLRRSAPRAEVDRTPLEARPLLEALAALAPTHLFLCHGTTARRARSEGIADPYETVDVGLTRLLCEAAATLPRPPRAVHLSSMGAGPRARGAYLSARWRAEEAVRASGLPYTICRPSFLTGPDRAEFRPGERFAAKLLDPVLGLLGALGARRLAARYRSMDAKEAAEGLVRTGFHYMPSGRVVLGDELRRRGVYETETPAPASRREGGRH
ncbi:MAG: NAD-dependent epimerase/dehydratase family protein [Planctomycetota bacterium]|nr:NAD-dependent epimerase/dehydratase family protein [Planctomycetota bacterium]